MRSDSVVKCYEKVKKTTLCIFLFLYCVDIREVKVGRSAKLVES